MTAADLANLSEQLERLEVILRDLGCPPLPRGLSRREIEIITTPLASENNHEYDECDRGNHWPRRNEGRFAALIAFRSIRARHVLHGRRMPDSAFANRSLGATLSTQPALAVDHGVYVATRPACLPSSS